MKYGKLNPVDGAVLSFPGFQRILNFTATGSESSVSVTVDGDVDKEYIILALGLTTDVHLKLNNDATAGIYGYQAFWNGSGTLSAGRYTDNKIGVTVSPGLGIIRLLTPSGFIKTAYIDQSYYSSGTTMSSVYYRGVSYNSTSNITSLNFVSSSGNFDSGTRITVYARRSQS